MAKGFGFAGKEREQRKARSSGSSAFAGKLVFKLPDDGDTGDIWFVEDDEGDVVYGTYVHEVPVEGRPYPDLVVCIAQDDEGEDTDDPCPGCEQDLKRKARYFVQVVWLDAPLYKRDENGKVVKDNVGDPVIKGEEDQLAVWPMGPELEEALEELDEEYGSGDESGLLVGPFTVKRKGLKLNTTYRIKPMDPKNPEQEMPDEIKELIESDEFIDLGEFTRPPSYEEFESRINGTAFQNKDDDKRGKNGKATRSAKRKNPFGKRRNEDDE